MTTQTLFPLPKPLTLPVVGETAEFPVHRIFCVGRNYAEHAREMGVEVDRESPFYFQKAMLAAVPSGTTLPYPPGTSNLHYEMELVVAIGRATFQTTVEDAPNAVYGYATGLDMTRRDLQQIAKDKRHPWDLGKDFEGGAVLAPITKAADFGPVVAQRIALEVNGDIRQDAHLSDLVWSIPEIIAHLSGFYHLVPGDLIFTGTPAGVGPVVAGDRLVGTIDCLSPVELTLGPAE